MSKPTTSAEMLEQTALNCYDELVKELQSKGPLQEFAAIILARGVRKAIE